MKDNEVYRDGAQGKSAKYPLGNEEKVLVQKISETPVEALVVPAYAPTWQLGLKLEEGELS